MKRHPKRKHGHRPAGGPSCKPNLPQNASNVDREQKVGLHITIGATPSSEDSDHVALAHEIQMVKASLLYADQTKLCSLASWSRLCLLFLDKVTAEQRLDFFASVVPSLMPKDDAQKLIANIDALRRPKHKDKNTSIFTKMMMAELNKAVAVHWEELAAVARELAEQAGTNELLGAIDAGVLDVHVFQASDTDSMVHEYVDVLNQTVADEFTFPLFDDASGSFVRAALAEGMFKTNDAVLSRSKHSAFVAQSLERLPLFELATVNEVVDIRRELARPLVRFRAAMLKFSDQIKTAAWDEGFSQEAHLVFLREIDPAILEIEDIVRTNRYMAALVRGITAKPADLAAKSLFGILISQTHFLSHVIATGVGAGVSGAAIAADIYKDWRDKQNTVESNHMFFYYQSRKILSQNHSN